MSVESENVEILKRGYREWHDSKGGKESYLLSILDDDVKLTSLAAGAEAIPFTRERSGKDEFLSYIDGLTGEWEMLHYNVDEYIAQGDRVVAVGSTSWRNKRTGKVGTTAKVDVWRMRGGKLVELSEFYDTAALIAAAQP